MSNPLQQWQERGDRAGRSHWDALWAAKQRSRAVGARPLTYVETKFSEMFERAFVLLGGTDGKRLLEIGCGDSAWLPYFAKRWSFRISGLDYSPIGCDRAAALVKAEGIDAEITCADLFAPPEEMLDAFDAVVSMGVVEHFDETAGVLRALARFLRPGGILITTIPNIAGIDGTLTKWINRPVYDIHVPLDAAALAAAHHAAGLNLTACDYLMSLNLAVVNTAGLDTRKISTKLKQLVVLGFIAASRAIWMLERSIHPLPVRPSLSPYIAAVAQRPAG